MCQWQNLKQLVSNLRSVNVNHIKIQMAIPFFIKITFTLFAYLLSWRIYLLQEICLYIKLLITITGQLQLASIKPASHQARWLKVK